MSKDKKTVLLVDDDTVLGQIVDAALTAEGYGVCYQNSLAGLSAVMRDVDPDIVILDVEIGLSDGIKAISQVRQLLPGVPVIIISSHTESSEVVRAMEEGATTYLKKPFEVEELSAYVRSYTADVHRAKRVKIGSLTLDPETRMIFLKDKALKRLTKLEYALLNLLAARRGEVVPRSEIEALWGDSVMNEHSLYNYVRHLKSYLEADASLVLEAREGGYCLRKL